MLRLHQDDRPFDCTDGCALLRAVVADDPLGVEVWRPFGDRRQPLLANAAAVTDEDGTVIEVVHSVRDITRLKEAEEAKTLFLATASHELKTPLTVIRGFVEMLDHGMDEATQRLAISAIHRRTIELGDIVDRLLLSSRIEAGRVELVLTDVDVVSVAAERVQAMASATGRAIGLQIDGELPRARGDAAALATVLDHLLDNAVKYSPDGGDIDVVVDRTSESILVCVVDHGVGMDDEQAARCFDKFWQAESSDVRRFGGTGIGLYIVRSLVEAMGGEVHAVGGEDRGTVFEIVLDVFREDAEDGQAGRGEKTMIGEFMRQIGVPGGVR
jgi:signal transduction histidine kinase